MLLFTSIWPEFWLSPNRSPNRTGIGRMCLVLMPTLFKPMLKSCLSSTGGDWPLDVFLVYDKQTISLRSVKLLMNSSHSDLTAITPILLNFNPSRPSTKK
jgi:hypothetical protein